MVVTGPLRCPDDFDQLATVADLVRDSGGYPVWAGDLALPIEAELADVATLPDVATRVLEAADIVLALPGWEDSPDALVDVRTAERAGAELVELG